MQPVARLLLPRTPVAALAALTFAAGVAGMAVSFLFLASDHQLDVAAGAAGFVAGSVLVAAGLVSISVQRPRTADESDGSTVLDLPPDVARWAAHFRSNKENRPEPDWAAPVTLPAAVIAPLVRSLEQFQLGDGGGPAYLIARDRERFLAAAEGTRDLVDLWFAEEREHARLLGGAVDRFGGRRIGGHWSFSAFCLVRTWLGVRFELTVLLLTEIVSTVYYRLLLRHGEDPALRSLCRLIMRDEIGHVSFHRDRLARQARAGLSGFGRLWAVQFRLLGLAAATVLWLSHAPGLTALGATRREFYRDIGRELSAFIARLRREVAAPAPVDGRLS
ncbi:MAG TPA: ferritin-like domain-containing protein [Gemmataceae bacterium]|nr:ferritin-like domain-containing protein [Gemmataceae bacterium]